MSSLVIQPAQIPLDTAFPENVQQLVNLVASALSVLGADQLEGVVVSESEPLPENRDKLWIKKDPSSARILGIYTYNGSWLPMPAIIPAVDTLPGNPKKGELVFDNVAGAIKVFTGTIWTSNLRPGGTTAARPESPPLGYLYFDTDISQQLRYTASGWTTDAGSIGDTKMVTDLTDDEATKRNPGWVVYEALSGLFPVGRSTTDDDFALGASGGNKKLIWSWTGNSAAGGSREEANIQSVTIDGTATTAVAGGSATSGNGEINVLPPFKAVLFLRKSY